MDATLGMWKELTEAPGIAGQEHRVRALMRRYLEPLAEVSVDHLGSVIGKKVGQSESPRIMLAGHMDEVGFLVTRITDEGYLRFQPVGGWWEQVLLAQRVRVITREGELVGVIGSRPPHVLEEEERKRPVRLRDMYIDIGVEGRAGAEAAGVRPGDMVVPDCPFTVLADPRYVMAKAWDNRIGCALVIDVLARLQGAAHPNTVYGVATVQEEVGLRGARTAAQTVRPDVGFALDVGIAADGPGVEPDDVHGRLGKGPQVLLYDASLVPHTRLRDLVLDTAQEAGIPVQVEVMARGGTDAGAISLVEGGVPSLAIGVPTRYIHSGAAVLHREDAALAAELLVRVVQRLDAQTVSWIRGL